MSGSPTRRCRLEQASAQAGEIVGAVCGLDDGDTFCEEGVAVNYDSNAAWRGGAIHYHDSYAELAP